MFNRFLIILFSIIMSHSVSLHAQETGKQDFTTSSIDILGEKTATELSETLKMDDEIKWSIFVPDNYNPASPPGIVVHMTEQNLAKLPIGWSTVLKEKNLIWISLNKAGHLKQDKEMLIAVLATPFIQAKYKVDRNRVYIVASTDSCYAASAAMEIYPDIFKGIVYSTCEPLNWKNDTPQTIDKMKENRYLFVSSNERDIKIAMRRAYRKYEDSGITKVEYMLIPKLIYGRQINRRKFMKSIEILDGLS